MNGPLVTRGEGEVGVGGVMGRIRRDGTFRRRSLMTYNMGVDWFLPCFLLGLAGIHRLGRRR